MSSVVCTHPRVGFTRKHVAPLPVSVLGVMVLLLGVCPGAKADRPPMVDHSTEMYFPPIGQQPIGDCTCWSSAYYYNTYTQARDEGLDASTGDTTVVCSPRFLFAIIAQGGWGAECTEHAMARLSDVGCATLSKHPMSVGYTTWPIEAAWIAGLDNRTGLLHKVRVDNEAGLETVKQHIADGGCAVTRADFLSNYGEYGSSGNGTGISNHVMYRREGWHYLRHSICICGYDDDRWYIDDRDGQVHYGAFLIANSEGSGWGWYNSTEAGTKGFIWIAYTMFIEQECGWYDYELEVSPCFDNAPYPEVYYHDDRPDYRPKLYAVAGINHSERNLLTFTGGVGPTGAPEFTGPLAIEPTDDGAIPISDTRRVAVDLTDGAGLIPPGSTKNVFISLHVGSTATMSARITSVDLYHDFDGDGTYTNVPGEMESPVYVPKGTTAYVSASIINEAYITGDLDCDGAVNTFDIDPFVLALTDPAGYESTYPTCNIDNADCNDDGDVNTFDIDPFVALLTGG